MDSGNFDRLTALLSQRMDRSRAQQALAGLGLAALGLASPATSPVEVDAKGKKKRKKKGTAQSNGGNNADQRDGGTQGGATETPKCLICHVPPGNPGNAHAIEVGCPATGPEGHSNHEGDCICGAKKDGQVFCHCPGGKNEFCYKGECVAEENPCGNRKCGEVTDRCGNKVPCGTCPEPKTCNHDGQCECVAEENPCGDRKCGEVTDRCGNKVPCGTCPEPKICNDNGYCVCVPVCTEHGQPVCGSDGCGGSCTCPYGTTCDPYSRRECIAY